MFPATSLTSIPQLGGKELKGKLPHLSFFFFFNFYLFIYF